jgi:hypothetical protein
MLFAAAIILGTAAATTAQVLSQRGTRAPVVASPAEGQANEDDLLRSVFDPVTDDLKLLPDQKFRIVTIAGLTNGITDPLFDQLDELDRQISLAALNGTLSEAAVKDLSTRQGFIISQISATFARAKAGIYKVLTPEQRAIILGQYRSADQNLGAISNVGP